MDGALDRSTADGGQRAGRARTWLTRLARPALAYSPSLAGVPDYLCRAAGEAAASDSDDDGTVYAGRSRSLSQASDGAPAAAAFDKGAARGDQVLDPARLDTAIAAMLCARQQDQLGNHDAAARLFVAGLERMSLALQGPERVADPHTRERLAMLRLLLVADGGDGGPASGAHDAGEGVARLAHPPAASATAGAAGGLSDMAAAAMAGMLALATQMAVMVLAFLGSAIAWAAAQLKNSTLPETAAGHLATAGSWAHAACQEHRIYENAARLGRTGVAWLVSVDRQAEFSQRLLGSAAAVLAAVARAVESAAAGP